VGSEQRDFGMNAGENKANNQLNLRNDALRRKFDSLKYDLKRCEDVVYDLTLRGLVKAPAS
jgi:hypothetical protein